MRLYLNYTAFSDINLLSPVFPAFLIFSTSMTMRPKPLQTKSTRLEVLKTTIS